MDLDRFVERAAIKEYEAGLSRFQAETEAAAEQGYARWQVMNAISDRDTRQTRHRGPADVGHGQNHLPALQCRPEEEARPLSQRDVSAGGGGVEVLARQLRLERGGILP